jgi:membrane protease YdiL (CAAX protease family)
MRLSHLRKEPGSSFVLLGFGTIGAALGLNLLLSILGTMERSESFQEVAQSQYSASLWVGLLCFGLITPVVEEVLFRGIAYGYLRHFTNIRFAILISAIIFSVYHGNSVQGIYAFLMGCLIAYGYEYFGNFTVAIAMHVGANLLAYLITYLAVPANGVAGWILCVVALAMMCGGFLGLHKRKNVL